MHHQSHHITITAVIIMSTLRDLRNRQMAVELARQPIKPVNAVQTWRELRDDDEGDNDDVMMMIMTIMSPKQACWHHQMHHHRVNNLVIFVHC